MDYQETEREVARNAQMQQARQSSAIGRVAAGLDQRVMPSRSMDTITERIARAVLRLGVLADNMNGLGNRYYGSQPQPPTTDAGGRGAEVECQLPAVEAAYRELNRLEYVVERCGGLMERLEEIA